ncbi:MAG: response regulator transcription factor [Verrucomicrobia bacterium]|nr:response regulator transcription factor [Verrucomicrobiota bacterium]
MATILIVDDENDIRELITLNLRREGYDTLEAADGLQAMKKARKKIPDLILLDLMLPEKDGYSVFRELKESNLTQNIPIIMLTARGKLDERITGLSLGADDYVTKPFSPKELLLRIKNILHRTQSHPAGTIIEIGDFRLDKNHLVLHLAGAAIDLTATEFKLLVVLIESGGHTQAREDLLRQVWGYNDLTQTRTLDTHIKRLREKLGDFSHQIETVRGVGYRFISDGKASS